MWKAVVLVIVFGLGIVSGARAADAPSGFATLDAASPLTQAVLID